MTVAVTHSKTLVSPDSGVEDKVYGSDYVDPDSHIIDGLGTAAEAATTDFDAAGAATSAVMAHEAEANPHPGYLTPAEGDAAYPPLAHDHTGAGQALVPEDGLDILNDPADRYIMSFDADSGMMEWITTTIYPATSISLIAGTLNAGDVTSLETRNDANIYDWQEVAATPGYDIRVSFSNVASFNMLRFQVNHVEGTGSHKAEYALWNVNTLGWDLLTSLRTTNGFVEADVTADNFSDYIDTGASDTVVCRIYHPIAGSGSHKGELEYMVIVDSIAGGGGISQHQALGGLDLPGSHPATAISNSPEGTIAATTVQAAVNELDGDIVAHKDDLGNPHATTKTQVGLGNVTDNSQLTRAAGDFATFAEKVAPIGTDVLLLEDSAAGGAKKFVQITNLPSSGGGVSAVSGTAPIVSSGGGAPDISILDFVASGASHARGAVPDPGASPGSTRFLREDATFAVPAGAGGGTDEVLLVPTSNKQIPANSSLLVADYYRLESGIQLLIESGANITISG